MLMEQASASHTQFLFLFPLWCHFPAWCKPHGMGQRGQHCPHGNLAAQNQLRPGHHRAQPGPPDAGQCDELRWCSSFLQDTACFTPSLPGSAEAALSGSNVPTPALTKPTRGLYPRIPSLPTAGEPGAAALPPPAPSPLGCIPMRCSPHSPSCSCSVRKALPPPQEPCLCLSEHNIESLPAAPGSFSNVIRAALQAIRIPGTAVPGRQMCHVHL